MLGLLALIIERVRATNRLLVRLVGTTSACLAAIRCSRSAASAPDCMLQGRSAAGHTNGTCNVARKGPPRPVEGHPPVEPYDPYGPGEGHDFDVTTNEPDIDKTTRSAGRRRHVAGQQVPPGRRVASQRRRVARRRVADPDEPAASGRSSGARPRVSGPILFGLTRDCRRGRVLDLEPVSDAARSVRRAEPL